MMAAQMNGGAARMHDDDSDDEGLATTLVEAMQEDDGDYDDIADGTGVQVTGDDLQARLAAAATPLDFAAGLPARFTSYDNYCSLFHFILNSDGPVDLELPTVSTR
jgi:translation initiation factor 3 subunit L